MTKKVEIDYLDNEERDIVDSYEQDEWVSVLTEEKKQHYREVAKNSMRKNRRINIRLTEKDYHDIQVKALQDGLPYQTLIAMLIHKYNQGKLTL